MRKSEKNKILQTVALWNDSKLEGEYYKRAFDCLGSQAERMFEAGFDISDVKEQEQIEKENCEYSDFLASICDARGIRLWHNDAEIDKIAKIILKLDIYSCADCVSCGKWEHNCCDDDCFAKKVAAFYYNTGLRFRKRGFWISMGNGKFSCSICHSEYDVKQFDFCPCCGSEIGGFIYGNS